MSRPARGKARQDHNTRQACSTCGQEFITTTNHRAYTQRYCSKTCAGRATWVKRWLMRQPA